MITSNIAKFLERPSLEELSEYSTLDKPLTIYNQVLIKRMQGNSWQGHIVRIHASGSCWGQPYGYNATVVRSSATFQENLSGLNTNPVTYVGLVAHLIEEKLPGCLVNKMGIARIVLEYHNGDFNNEPATGETPRPATGETPRPATGETPIRYIL